MAAAGLVASILLGLVFLVSGGSKLAAGPAWPEQARGLGAPAAVVPVLPWLELVLGALLVVQLAPIVAASVALVVLGAFTVLIVRRLSEGEHPPCACFGAWSTKPLGRGHVARNAGFMALGVVALFA
ncbi:MAG TPA: MauE/DoxX family redox-associated membrane protein [Ilumatobacteraceae bacterium]|nr:MauE/DoxX family redox-associated membrane protein [Ilumatobacteraceae bacterium]